MSPHHIDLVSRRRLLQFLAASPLLTQSALAEGLRPSDPEDWAPRELDMTQLGAPSLKDFTPAMVRRV
jgi:hypothetical protein